MKKVNLQKKRVFILINMIALLSIASCQSKKEEEKEESKYLVTSPFRKDTSTVKEYVCQIHSISHIELRAQERGFLQNIYVDEGQRVKKGQLLFQIMPKMYEAELQIAKAEADYAEIEYKNVKLLADSNIVSVQQLALEKAKFDKAKSELALAQVHLSFTEIRAPFDGLIDKFQARLGSLIDEGDLLTSLSDNRKMWVYFNVPEAEYLDYMEKVKSKDLMVVKLEMANGKLFDYPGIVETIEADFNNETGNIAFRATFQNPESLLRHGETGKILMNIALPNALLIPQKTTFEILDKKYVFVVDANNVLQAREIEIGAEIPHIYAVTKGLVEGDKILLEGLRKVKEGQKIEYEFQDPATVLANLGLYSE